VGAGSILSAASNRKKMIKIAAKVNAKVVLQQVAILFIYHSLDAPLGAKMRRCDFALARNRRRCYFSHTSRRRTKEHQLESRLHSTIEQND
jgi:hypothetical protein